MPTFIAFLRAVNVGKRQYPMAELREALTNAGFEEVATHIQTGNALVHTRMRSRAKVTAALEKTMLEDRGFAVPVVLMTPAELTETHDEALTFAREFTQQGNEIQGHYLTLLAEPATAAAARSFEAKSEPGEEVRVGKRAVHLLLAKSYSEASTSNAEVERHLGIATTRSLTVITKLAEKWGQ
ncbi:MAG: DUF1697 domain-containing protein [Marmoricola sp.]